jgi:ZIP family zinc transporter
MEDYQRPIVNVLLFSLFPLVAAIAGAAIAAYRPPSSIIRSYIQHLAAGVVFSVVAVELLPEIIAKHEPVEVAIGFSVGVLLMLGIRQWVGKLEGSGESKDNSGLLIGVAVDVVLDGLLIGISFSAGGNAGMLLTLALTVELLSLGLAVATTLGKSGQSPRSIILTCSWLFGSLSIGAVVGVASLQNASDEVLEIVLSFGLAALLFLVTEELLVDAHEEPETLLSTGIFFAGFLLFLILGMM